jgi:hypothetical protein
MGVISSFLFYLMIFQGWSLILGLLLLVWIVCSLLAYTFVIALRVVDKPLTGWKTVGYNKDR